MIFLAFWGLMWYDNESQKGCGFMNYLAQGVSIIGMLLSVFSFQCKSNRKLIFVQGLASTFFALSYIPSGAYDSMLCNVLNIVNMLLLMYMTKNRKLGYGIIFVLSVLMSLFTYTGPWTLVLMAQLLVGNFSLWFCDGATIRKVRFFFVSPVWFINNIFFAFNIGGILCEIFVMTSVIVSLIRYGKEGFTK